MKPTDQIEALRCIAWLGTFFLFFIGGILLGFNIADWAIEREASEKHFARPLRATPWYSRSALLWNGQSLLIFLFLGQRPPRPDPSGNPTAGEAAFSENGKQTTRLGVFLGLFHLRLTKKPRKTCEFPISPNTAYEPTATSKPKSQS